MKNVHRADAIIPGDVIDTRCGIPGFMRVESVKYIDRPGVLTDQVEIKCEGNAFSRVYRACSEVSVWEGDPAAVGV